LVSFNLDAQFDKRFNNRSLIGREDIDGQVVGVTDAAYGLFLDIETVHLHWFDLDRGQLAGREIDGRTGRRARYRSIPWLRNRGTCRLTTPRQKNSGRDNHPDRYNCYDCLFVRAHDPFTVTTLYRHNSFAVTAQKSCGCAIYEM
jgi:hypothetical protein